MPQIQRIGHEGPGLIRSWFRCWCRVRRRRTPVPPGCRRCLAADPVQRLAAFSRRVLGCRGDEGLPSAPRVRGACIPAAGPGGGRRRPATVLSRGPDGICRLESPAPIEHTFTLKAQSDTFRRPSPAVESFIPLCSLVSIHDRADLERCRAPRGRGRVCRLYSEHRHG